MKKLLLVGISLLVVLTLATWGVYRLPTFGGSFEGERWQRMQTSPEFEGGRFENKPPHEPELALMRNLQAYLENNLRHPSIKIPVLTLDPKSLEEPAGNGLKVIWFGHATVLVEIDGLRIMTDPILSDLASPLPIGPRRFHRPPLALADLKNIDAVVISHDHYDHLDMASIKHLASQGTHFYVGLGVGAHLERWQVPLAQIHELDWWESIELKGVKIHCTPARHYSGRKAPDNSTLWASWMIRSREHSIFYSGDTGYAPHFAEIHKRFGETDLSIMKVGSYHEIWQDIHMNPEAAVRAHKDLGAKVLLPVHWGTFNLAYHDWNEPAIRTLEAAKAAGVEVITPRFGEAYKLGAPFENQEWYRGEH